MKFYYRYQLLILTVLLGLTLAANAQAKITAKPSETGLFFETSEGFPSPAKAFSVTISGTVSTAKSALTLPAFYELFTDPAGPHGGSIIFTGNGTFNLFIRYTGRPAAEDSTRIALITGLGFIPVKVELRTINYTNPSYIPNSLSFRAVAGRRSERQTVAIRLFNLSSNAKTTVEAPNGFSLLVNPLAQPVKKISLVSNVTNVILVQMDASSLPGTLRPVPLTVTGNEIKTSTFFVSGQVFPNPQVTTSPSALSGFTAFEGGAFSAPQSFDIAVKNILNEGSTNFFVTAPKGYQVSLSGIAGTFVNSLVLLNNNGKINLKLFVSLQGAAVPGPVKGDLLITGAQIDTIRFPLSGTTIPKPQPFLQVDKTALSGFTTTTNKSSAVQSYLLTAGNLAAGTSVLVKAPAGFEISQSTAATFVPQFSITPVSGKVSSTVFVRLKASAVAGNFSGQLQHTVAGLSKVINLSGTIVPPPSLNFSVPSLSGFTSVQNEASATKIYTLTAANLAAGQNAVLTAPSGYELRVQNTGNFAGNLTLTQTATGTINRVIEVRLKAGILTGSIIGSITHAVAGINKVLSVSGSVTAASLAVSTTGLVFTAIQGAASAVSSYKLNASGIATSLAATVSASQGYELSLSAVGPFTGSLQVAQTSLHSISKDIFVRLKASAVTGQVKGTITHSIAGLNKSITLSGTIQPLKLFASLDTLNGKKIFDRFFPNPVTDKLTLELQASANGKLVVQLFNLNGTCVFQQVFQAFAKAHLATISLGHLPPGPYLLVVSDGNTKQSNPLLKL